MFGFDLPRELLLAGPRQDSLRFVVALCAIALGVALGFAILSINEHAKSAFERAARDISGEAHLSVRGPRGGFSEAIYASLAAREDVAFASPSLELDVSVPGIEEPIKLMGIDIFRIPHVQPGLMPVVPEGEDSLLVLRDDHLFVSAAARHRWNLKVGEVLRVQVGTRVLPLQIAGTLISTDGAALVVMDIANVQMRFERTGLINRIDLTLNEGVDTETVRAAIAATLPPGVHVLNAHQSDAFADRIARAYRVNLNVLALVALFTAALLVYATQSLSVVKRAAQHALWRALGATASQIRGALILEALATGLIGALLGVVGGQVIALLIMRWSGGDLGSGMAPIAQLAFDISYQVVGIMVFAGVLAALLGAWLPALRGARVSVASALKGLDDHRHVLSRWRKLLGGLLMAVGAALCVAPAVEGLPLFGYAAIAAMLLGTIALLPFLAALILRTARQDLPLALALPAAQLRAALPQVSLSLSATVAAVSLTVSMAIMVSSFRESLTQWLIGVLPADMYVRAGQPSDTAFLDELVQGVLRKHPGVRQVQFQRSLQIWLQPDRPRITLLARDRLGDDFGQTLPIVGRGLEPSQARHPSIWVSEIAQDLYGFQMREEVTIPIAGHGVKFTVAGVWRDYARQNGALLFDRGIYTTLTGDKSVTEAAVWLDQNVAMHTVIDAIIGASPTGRLEVSSPEELRQRSLRIFDNTFAITYALEAGAILIGLIALSSGIGALILTRGREFGVMRHLGFAAAQIRRMLAVEGILTTGVGLLVGTTLGWIMSLVLIHVVNKQSFHWSMDMKIPWMGLLMFCGALMVLATLTSWWSARRTMSNDLIAAVKHDW